MTDIHYWIQIENRPWDACPNNIDRMHGQTIEELEGVPPIDVTLTSPETGVVQTRTMYMPVNEGTDGLGEWEVKDALIFRRYTENWAEPDDRKINPWDLNEPNPTDTGTMGTIPGATLECEVGDKIIVHFRNKDFRSGMSLLERSHSMHPHGIVFKPEYDGAYPLSPADITQPVDPVEAAAWANVGVTGGFKKGDRVPPGGTFNYTWDTFGWPATTGVWHYHDHAICDSINVLLGARGFLVIHNPADPDDVIHPDLPNEDPNGSLTNLICFPFPDFPLKAHPLALERTALLNQRVNNFELISPSQDNEAFQQAVKELQLPPPKTKKAKEATDTAALALELPEGIALALGNNLSIRQICFRLYLSPPAQAQYLQYYSELDGVGMVINGRRFMGNTPTLLSGTDTKMRFGVASMNNLTFHTFHLHGHRWTIPGPDGITTAAIQSSPQVAAASQFEDTRMIGPANSFGFTINQGSFMGSRFTPDLDRASALGEWHMHCHVLNHMMPGGMMGSLLVIEGGELAFTLPRGVPKGEPDELPGDTVLVDLFAFTPNTLSVPSGTTVTFDFQEANHTVTTTAVTGAATAIEINNGGGPIDAIPVGQSRDVTITGNPGDKIEYICGIHGAAMSGEINII